MPQTRRLGPAWLGAGALLLALALPGPASAPVPAAAPPTLTVEGGGTPDSADPNVARQDLGPVNAASDPTLRATFVLRNAGAGPVTITDLRTSCGCTSALVGAEGSSGTPKTLAPGEKTRVQVTVRLAGLDGPISKLVWVYTPASLLPAVTLEVAATVQQAVTFSPGMLDFGVVPAGSSPAQTLTVTADRRLLGTAAPLPALISSNSDVRVVRLKDGSESGPVIVRAYSVAVSPRAPLGHLFGALTLAGSPGGPSAFLTGEVVGSVSAAPGTVLFGEVPAGRAATAKVSLTFASATAARRARVAGASPWLSARLRPSGATAAVLEVVLSARTPPGPLSSEVTVVTGGERLALPVIADVERRARALGTAGANPGR